MSETNRLIHESSPYLKQHAYNPVDWYPWGEEALKKAKAEDKPIILSIGYSACHWCHVMEHECFEDEEVAQLMNQHFISIKVDREERPDIDAIYMDAMQAMGLGGGWPLNVFLTSDQKPFYGGTYFPKKQWMNLLSQVAKTYELKRDEVEESATSLVDALNTSKIKRLGINADSTDLPLDSLAVAVENLMQQKDPAWGGLNRAPKFPMPSIWHHLLYYYLATDNDSVKTMLTKTLDQMHWGGIYDHIGGGFARYSVDERWQVPHFEKMLYDNGQLISLYADAYRFLGNDAYRKVVDETIAFVKKELSSPDGGFYSALDADSEGEEGKYYVWTEEEIKQFLPEDGDWIMDYFRISPYGNWEEGKNVLWINPEVAVEDPKKLQEFKQKLLAEREKRVKPGLDDKIICSWNGLLLTGLCKAYLATGTTEYLVSAEDLALFIDQKMTDGDKLLRVYADGKAKTDAFIEDYAAVIQGYLHLYQVSFEEKWLFRAKTLTDHCLTHYLDKEEGYFYYSAPGSSQLIANQKELFDNVIPASNSLMANNLIILARLTSESQYLDRGAKMTRGLASFFERDLAYLSQWAINYLMLSTPHAEVALVGNDAEKYLLALASEPHFNLVFAGTQTESQVPLLENREALDGKTTCYVCFDTFCRQPVTNPEDAADQIESEFGKGSH